jgi:hypothetical protein
VVAVESMAMVEPDGDPQGELFAVPPPPRRLFFTQREAMRELGIDDNNPTLLRGLIAGANITLYGVGNAQAIDDIGMEQLRTAYQRYRAGRSNRGRRPGRRNRPKSQVPS